jgi:hypothetical protein
MGHDSLDAMQDIVNERLDLRGQGIPRFENADFSVEDVSWSSSKPRSECESGDLHGTDVATISLNLVFRHVRGRLESCIVLRIDCGSGKVDCCDNGFEFLGLFQEGVRCRRTGWRSRLVGGELDTQIGCRGTYRLEHSVATFDTSRRNIDLNRVAMSIQLQLPPIFLRPTMNIEIEFRESCVIARDDSFPDIEFEFGILDHKPRSGHTIENACIDRAALEGESVRIVEIIIRDPIERDLREADSDSIKVIEAP